MKICLCVFVLMIGGCMNPPVDERRPLPPGAMDTLPQPPGLPAADNDPPAKLLEPRR